MQLDISTADVGNRNNNHNNQHVHDQPYANQHIDQANPDTNRSPPPHASIGLPLESQMADLTLPAKPPSLDPSPATPCYSVHSSQSEMPISALYSIDPQAGMDTLPSHQHPVDLFQELLYSNHHINRHSYTNEPIFSPSSLSSVRLSLNRVSKNLSSPFDQLTNSTVYSGNTISRTSSYPHVRSLFSHQCEDELEMEMELEEERWLVKCRLEEVLRTLSDEEIVDDGELMEVVSLAQDFQHVFAGMRDDYC